ncbi:TolC family outer membrane protein [Aquabacterium sp. OR-4]|uniref:TolC family outer membrane protein n=1 Tax=Aquabacterium sp. OR-4 TaxID=2978127 RepID=UPI0021B4AFA1|nr:TolC family outer membrane protein [Aquabacterium sp. OR-4]MDT7838372.1 TolC family outer membrane protein [Aquabacterium sp. OR-4]
MLSALTLGTADAQSLVQLHERALAADPAVRAAEASWQAADQRVFQARAAFGPTASASVSTNQSRYREEPAESVRPFHSTQYTAQVSQPVWRGTLFPALEGARLQRDQAGQALAQARIESRQRLLEALLELFKARDVMAHAEAQREALQAQLALARRSFQVGRAAVTEVREAEARVDHALAQRLAAEAELELRQQVLAEVAGGPVPDLPWRALAGDALPPRQAGGVHDWLGVGEQNSPQLLQARLALAVAEAEIRKAELAHAPSVELNYSYSKSNDTGTVTSFFPRRGTSSAVGATLNVPLFASGATQSKVAEAQALRDKARGELDLARRTLVIGVRQAFAASQSAAAQAQALTTAERSQALSVRANQRGYEVGLKVNAEVLEAQGKLFEARRDLSRARHDAWAQHFRLRALVGELGDADMLSLDSLLQVWSGAEMSGPRTGTTP